MITPQEDARRKPTARPGRIVAAAGSLVLAAVAVWFIVSYFREGSRVNVPKGIYFANEDTGERSIQPLGSIPPLNDVEGNPKLVRAVLYSTDGGKTKIAAYYEKYADAAKKMADAAASDPNANFDNRLYDASLLVRLPAQGSPWVYAQSPEGEKVKANLPTGDNITPCSVALP